MSPQPVESRIREAFASRHKQNSGTLVVYLTCGDPSLEETVDIVKAVADAGADVVELGVPFSDPNADGVAIQGAMLRALAAGGGLRQSLHVVSQVRQANCNVPIVLFGYYNPIYIFGPEPFAKACQDSGVDAVLTVDLPIDELNELSVPLSRHKVGVVPLIAPTSGSERIQQLRGQTPPFVYYISVTGVTGANISTASESLTQRIVEVRDAAQSPVAVGFGIKTAKDAAFVYSQGADGVVVGSAIVECIRKAPRGQAAEKAAALVAALRSALVPT